MLEVGWGGRWGHGAKTNTEESREQQGGLSYMPGPEQNIGMRRQELKQADLDLIQWLGLAVKETKLIKPVRQGSREQGWGGRQ